MELIENEAESRRDNLLHIFRFYARRTNQNKEFKIWTSDNHPEEIETETFMRTKLQYIHNNPVRAGWVAEPEHYLYSSANNYTNGNGLMIIDFLF